jgi:hypothetical protein
VEGAGEKEKRGGEDRAGIGSGGEREGVGAGGERHPASA